MSSPLSLSVKRLGQILRDGAEGQVGESEGRLGAASETHWPLIQRLLKADFDPNRSLSTSKRIFSGSTVKFAAIDGSLDQQLLGGLAVFWAGSYACTGTVTYNLDDLPTITYDTGFVQKGEGLASCVPIYVDSIPEVDPQVQLSQSGNQLTMSRPETQQDTVDNSTIANWLMLFSELYLSYELAKSGNYRIILLDRSLSGTLSSLMYDTSRRALWKRQCSICMLEIDKLPLDDRELAYGRYHTVDLSSTLPPRGDYLRYAEILLLERAGKALGLYEIATQLDCTSEDRLGRLTRFLNKSVEEGYVQESNGKYMLNPRYADSWNRIRRVVELFGTRFFKSNLGNPLQIKNNDETRWMTTLDLAFLSLFTLNMLVEESSRKGIFLVGITKDTTARDLINHLLPVCRAQGIWKDKFERVATTDRMLLQAVSMFHHAEVPIPWASIEYDTAFQTIVPDFQGREGYVSGAIKNRIILEQRFVKSYIQLDKSKSDDKFRSNVLFIDRLYHKELENAPTLNLKHDYTAVENVTPILWNSKELSNPVQELLMITLKAMTQQSLPEVFGHNKPLYIADKIAKAQRDRASQIVRATGHWLSAHPKLRKFSFYMNTFRSRRSEAEYARSQS
ncbi:MAG TPA: hypothetical protein VMU35_09455 [Methylomirabilota bacterium]|nr:hypothetical protein [Methylomirabilota bacterium]